MSLIVASDPAPVTETPAAVTPPVAAAPTGAVENLFPVAAPAAEPVAAPDASPPVRPEGVPDALWDPATGIKTTEAIARLGELEAADAARKEGVPADASGYKLELAEPINDPTTGKPIGFNADDPLAKSAVAWAAKNQVSQGALSELLGAFATNEMSALAEHNANVSAETAKLGPQGQARIEAVSAALAKHSDAAGAKAIMSSLGSAEAVSALEKVIKSITGPSLGTPPVTTKSPTDGLHGVALLSAHLK